MSYQALYRAWRPQTFSDLIGQPHVRQTLMNAMASGQVAHAYLFCGPRGTGKTSAAKVLAKAVNCQSQEGTEPCNTCEACVSIANGSNVDVEEIDAASNRGVDEIRQLRDKVQYAPASVVKKVYIVDEVHMLTTEAFNALLKTLEEPPSHTLFILATTEPHKIPATIISRCQRFDFRRIEPELIISRLREICVTKDWSVDDEALWRIAEAADGGLRDALGLLEQTAAFARGNITAEAAAHVMGGVQTDELLALILDLTAANLSQVMTKLIGWYSGGKDATRILYEVLQLLRDLFIVKLSGTPPERLSRRYPEVAGHCSEDWLLDSMQKLGEVYVQLRYVDQPRLALETALLGLVPRQRPTESVPKVQADAVLFASKEEDTATQSTTKPSTPVQPRKEGKPETRRSSTRNSGNRKLEVLRQLQEDSSAALLKETADAFPDVLAAVKNERITTHAWLMNGEPVLATGNTVVLAFGSRIHRDAVMKQEERSLIEQVLETQFRRPIQVLALLKSDWETFQNTVTQTTEPAVSRSQTEADDLANRAVALFGRDLVEIDDKE